ncbi:hypothetical protein CTI12_AA230960 [Artemisia annua]|uniref:Ulp1 protease family, C-terminal catalytic domain-containing protein n=1 Tax=Artemisia annua TaxID=35608 RepID=A0A2U1NT17_ARTAN|nr:hypothetical protein CTI12_AA230960 [Artemisia annua]
MYVASVYGLWFMYKVLREKGRISLWKKPIMLKKSRLMLNKILLTDFCCSKFVNLQHKNFRNFMRSSNHEKANEILKTVITRREFHWPTDRRTNDCGVFVMRHMEHYMGYNILRWYCGIEDDNMSDFRVVNAVVKTSKVPVRVHEQF